MKALTLALALVVGLGLIGAGACSRAPEGPGPGERPGLVVTAQPVDSPVVEVSLPGIETPLFLRKVMVGQREALVADPASGTPYLRPSPDGARYVIQVENHLYLLDARTLEVRALTPNTIGRFNYEKLLERTLQTEASLLWADQPVWSSDGRKVFYVSNRRDVAESTGLQEIWAVDLTTGSHELVYEHAGVYLLGCHQDQVILDDSRDIVAVSLSTRQARTVVERGRPLGFGQGKVLTAEDYLASDELLVTDLETGERRPIQAPVGTTFTRALPSPRGGVYATVVRDFEGNHAVAIYAAAAGSPVSSPSIFRLPNGFTTVSGMSFLDDEHLSLSLQKLESGNVIKAAYMLRVKGGN